MAIYNVISDREDSMRHAFSLIATTLVVPVASYAQFGMASMMTPVLMMNPLALGMMNPAIMTMAPMTLGMMTPLTMMSYGGMAGMNSVQYLTNPYLNPASSLIPFLNMPGVMGNPYLMTTPQPQVGFGSLGRFGKNPYLAQPSQFTPQAGLFPFLPVPAISPEHGMPQLGFSPIKPLASASAASQRIATFKPVFPVAPTAQSASQATRLQTATQPVAASPTPNMFDPKAWAQMFPNSVPSNMPLQPASSKTQAGLASQPANMPNFFDPKMWRQWVSPAAPK